MASVKDELLHWWVDQETWDRLSHGDRIKVRDLFSEIRELLAADKEVFFACKVFGTDTDLPIALIDAMHFASFAGELEDRIQARIDVELEAAERQLASSNGDESRARERSD
jgi:hypothetical protein